MEWMLLMLFVLKSKRLQQLQRKRTRMRKMLIVQRLWIEMMLLQNVLLWIELTLLWFVVEYVWSMMKLWIEQMLLLLQIAR